MLLEVQSQHPLFAFRLRPVDGVADDGGVVSEDAPVALDGVDAAVVEAEVELAVLGGQFN